MGVPLSTSFCKCKHKHIQCRTSHLRQAQLIYICVFRFAHVMVPVAVTNCISVFVCLLICPCVPWICVFVYLPTFLPMVLVCDHLVRGLLHTFIHHHTTPSHTFIRTHTTHHLITHFHTPYSSRWCTAIVFLRSDSARSTVLKMRHILTLKPGKRTMETILAKISGCTR